MQTGARDLVGTYPTTAGAMWYALRNAYACLTWNRADPQEDERYSELPSGELIPFTRYHG